MHARAAGPRGAGRRAGRGRTTRRGDRRTRRARSSASTRSPTSTRCSRATTSTPSPSAPARTRTPTSWSPRRTPARRSSWRSRCRSTSPRSTARWPPSSAPGCRCRSASTAASTRPTRPCTRRSRRARSAQPHIVRISSRDPHPPPLEYARRSGGIFLDMTIHDFDMARYVTGVGGRSRSSRAAPCASSPSSRRSATWTPPSSRSCTTSGCLTVIDNSRQAVYGYDQRVEAFGAAGVAASENPPEHTASRARRERHPRPAPAALLPRALPGELRPRVAGLRRRRCGAAWRRRWAGRTAARRWSSAWRRGARCARAGPCGWPRSMPEPFDLLATGRIGVDIYPEQPGPLASVRTFEKSIGGTATNVAVACARLGRRVALVTKVGDDAFGDYVRVKLEGFGVDTRWVGTAPDLPTPVGVRRARPARGPAAALLPLPEGAGHGARAATTSTPTRCGRRTSSG